MHPSIATPKHNRSQLVLLLGLGLASSLSMLLLAARIMYSGATSYTFLAWNLFLAWIPLVAALLIWRLHGHKKWLWPISGGLALLWLSFFPNAPYIVTDLMHLRPRNNVPIWYDLLLIFSFAWNGLIVGFASLRIMQEWVRSWAGVWAGWLFALGVLGLSGFGIYIGRFLRWNSWELLTSPGGLANEVLFIVTEPTPRTVAVTVLYAAFLIAAYTTLYALSRTQWRR